MSDDYNLDAIPNSIFDNIIMDDSMNMDEIFVDISEDTCLQDPTAIAVYETEVNAKSSSVEYPILQHDCMWSGTCDISHPGKKKAKPFSVEAILKEFEASSESDSGKVVNFNHYSNLKYKTYFQTRSSEAIWHQTFRRAILEILKCIKSQCKLQLTLFFFNCHHRFLRHW